jgi:hypothetical protein
MVKGKPSFELLPIRPDDEDFIDELLQKNPAFRRLAATRKAEADRGEVSTLDEVRARLGSSRPHQPRRRRRAS